MELLDLLEPYDPGLGHLVEVLRADLEAVARKHKLSKAPSRIAATRKLIAAWRETMDQISLNNASTPVRVDHALIVNHLDKVEIETDRAEATRPDFPFADTIIALDDDREAMLRPDPQVTAQTLDQIARQIQSATPDPNDLPAMEWAKELSQALQRWADFHADYDPTLTWWTQQPLAAAQKAMAKYLTQEAEGSSPSEAGGGGAPATEGVQRIPGTPVGREHLLQDLELAFIDETPEELIAIGDAQYQWCLAEMKKASQELGFQDDWKAALEYVKNTALPPGEQPWMVRDLALEAIEYLEDRDLLTIPTLAKETWQMQMMSAERQKTSPFFLGGETIIVSYPTQGMTHDEKLMSMRGNNPNFSRATVQHELIPGHHMQSFFTSRYRPYRKLFWTPFWVEGWTIYWELLLWELGFPRTPEERIGMLFWRMHRCARISFSLRFHLGQLTAEECVEILVDQVGHERANAEGEVRRSFGGLYPPLYQLAYMIGGLKFKEIQEDLVKEGKGLKRLHDSILKENHLPPKLLRRALAES